MRAALEFVCGFPHSESESRFRSDERVGGKKNLHSLFAAIVSRNVCCADREEKIVRNEHSRGECAALEYNIHSLKLHFCVPNVLVLTAE